jgi:hypothetical protein
MLHLLTERGGLGQLLLSGDCFRLLRITVSGYAPDLIPRAILCSLPAD